MSYKNQNYFGLWQKIIYIYWVKLDIITNNAKQKVNHFIHLFDQQSIDWTNFTTQVCLVASLHTVSSIWSHITMSSKWRHRTVRTRQRCLQNEDTVPRRLSIKIYNGVNISYFIKYKLNNNTLSNKLPNVILLSNIKYNIW